MDRRRWTRTSTSSDADDVDSGRGWSHVVSAILLGALGVVIGRILEDDGISWAMLVCPLVLAAIGWFWGGWAILFVIGIILD